MTRPWLLERWNDALWTWAMGRMKRTRGFYWWVARVSYLTGKVIDR